MHIVSATIGHTESNHIDFFSNSCVLWPQWSSEMVIKHSYLEKVSDSDHYLGSKCYQACVKNALFLANEVSFTFLNDI